MTGQIIARQKSMTQLQRLQAKVMTTENSVHMKYTPGHAKRETNASGDIRKTLRILQDQEEEARVIQGELPARKEGEETEGKMKMIEKTEETKEIDLEDVVQVMEMQDPPEDVHPETIAEAEAVAEEEKEATLEAVTEVQEGNTMKEREEKGGDRRKELQRIRGRNLKEEREHLRKREEDEVYHRMQERRSYRARSSGDGDMDMDIHILSPDSTLISLLQEDTIHQQGLPEVENNSQGVPSQDVA